MTEFDAVWVNAQIASMTENGQPYGAIAHGALAIKDGLIAYIGPQADLPQFDALSTPLYDAKGQWMPFTHGLVAHNEGLKASTGNGFDVDWRIARLSEQRFGCRFNHRVV